MFELSELLSSIILISIGASLGSFLRLQIIHTSQKQLINSQWAILFINCIASFFLGFVIGLEKNVENASTPGSSLLFFNVGFLGSFSTFSSFVWVVFDKLIKQKWAESLLLIFTSIFGGLCFAVIGFRLGNA